jgi:hypothetical protein
VSSDCIAKEVTCASVGGPERFGMLERCLARAWLAGLDLNAYTAIIRDDVQR